MKELREALARQPEPDRDLPPVVGTFLRGLSLGALVGAAVAGSLLVRSRRSHPGEGATTIKPPPS